MPPIATVVSRLLAGALPLLATGTLQAAPLALSGDGGDAWSFRKLVTGDAPTDCGAVFVASPAGRVPAERDGGRFFAEVPLHEGTNEVRAVCRRDGWEEVSAAQRWRVRLSDRPRAWVRVSLTERGLGLDAGRSEPAVGRPAPVTRVEWHAGAGNPAPLQAVDGHPLDGAQTRRLWLRTPAADGRYRVTLRVTDALGRSDSAAAVFRVEHGTPVAADPRDEPPAWLDDAVVYGVVPWLFGPRGLPDVTARLDAIAALGVNTLWLSPLADAPGDDFGYAVADPFAVRRRFGSEEDLKALVTAAHARGLRVLMDVVPNHLAEQSAYYADAAARGPASPYHRFFDRETDGTVTHYFDWTNLKNLNYDDPEVQRYTTAAFTHWLRDVGVDGFRVDAAWAVRERAPEFWPRLRAELKRIDPDVLLLAEASARDPWYATHGFDAAYDWTDSLGQWAWHDAFDDPARTAGRLRAALAAWDGRTPVFRFLNNNDTGARFISRHGVGRTRLAATLLLTLPGLPGLYAGDEVGADFLPYGGPHALAWDDPHGLSAHYRRLIALRHANAELRGHAFQLLATEADDRVLAYRRGGLLVLLNFADTAVDVAVPARGAVSDLLSGEALTLDGHVTLPPLGARVLAGDGRQTAER